MIIYAGNSKKLTTTTKLHLELISDYSKVAEYKVNMQRSITFLYTNNKKIQI